VIVTYETSSTTVETTASVKFKIVQFFVVPDNAAVREALFESLSKSIGSTLSAGLNDRQGIGTVISSGYYTNPKRIIRFDTNSIHIARSMHLQNDQGNLHMRLQNQCIYCIYSHNNKTDNCGDCDEN
jgi:hypothetical protein